MESWVNTRTIATSVLRKCVTITSLIYSGQNDASETFKDILSRSPCLFLMSVCGYRRVKMPAMVPSLNFTNRNIYVKDKWT